MTWQAFKTDANAAAEQEIAAAVATFTQACWHKIGTDDQQQRPRIDALFSRYGGRVVGFAEFKDCPRADFRHYPDFLIAEKKITNLRLLHEIVQVRCVVVVRFKCGTVAWFDAVTSPYTKVMQWGRSDRGGVQADLEPSARFAWSCFRVIK
jgi:hypothetical protein